MYVFRVTFESDLDGKRKSVKVEASGMRIAVEEGIHKFYFGTPSHSFDYTIVKCEQINGRYKG